MEEVMQFIEHPDTSTVRLNTDAIQYLGNAFTEVDDADIKLKILDLIEKHSAFVLKTSDKILVRQKLHMQQIK